MKTAAVLCIIATGAAAQDCPTADDLETGVRLVRDAPFSTSFFHRRSGELLVVDRQMNRDGIRVEDTTTYQHPLIPAVRESGADTLEISIEQDPSQIDRRSGPLRSRCPLTARSLNPAS